MSAALAGGRDGGDGDAGGRDRVTTSGAESVAGAPDIAEHGRAPAAGPAAADAVLPPALSEALLQAQSDLGEGCVVMDGERFVYVNDAFVEMTGFSRDELLALPSVLELMTADSAQGLRERIQERLSGRVVERHYETAIRAADGRRVELEVAVKGLRPGDPRRVAVIVRDVTERKWNERSLALQFAVATMLGTAPGIDAAAMEALRLMRTRLGWDLGQLWRQDPFSGGLRVTASSHDGGAAAGFEAASRATRLASGVGLPGQVWARLEPAWIENVILDPTFPRAAAATASGLHTAVAFPIVLGDVVWGVAELFARDVRARDDRILATVSAVGQQLAQYIERKESEAALRASEARTAAILEASLDCIVSMDADGAVIDFNAAAERTFGYRREDVLGRQLCELIIPPRLRDAHRAALARYLRTGEARVIGRRIETFAMRADGTEFPVELGLARISLPGPPLFTSEIRDLTERRELEAQLLHAQKMEAVGRLAGGVAHDFNNVLTAISGYAQLLSDDLPEGDHRRRDAEEIQRAAAQGATLTRQLLTLSRRDVVTRSTIALDAVVQELGPVLRRLVGSTVALEIATEHVLVRADPNQLQQVILNLVLNARDALSDGGGRIAIRVARLDQPAAGVGGAGPSGVALAGPIALLEVSDTGVGMDAETRTRMFEPFFTTKERGKGTGLGLATVYAIVHSSEGAIQVESEPGAGTTVAVLLPAASGLLEDRPETPARAPGGEERILLVEDEDAVRRSTAELLRRQGYRVESAPDAEAALDVLRRTERFDLLLTDVVMPGLTGPELARRVRRERPDLAVLYVSGHPESELVQADVDRGEAGYLAKPYTADVLARKVRECLDRRRGAAAPAVRPASRG